jgi:DNA-binding NarL/FixJ family response regulator
MKKNILIVEDEAIVAKDICQILEKNNYHVVGVAHQAEKALELFSRTKVDMVLCDINLGHGMRGIELAKKLKAINQDVHIVFLSAYTDEETITDAFGIEPDSYLTKPFSEKQLIVTTKRVLNQELGKSTEDQPEFPTKREREIIRCIADGLTSKEIALKLAISFETVQTHRKNIHTKYNLNSSAELIKLALKNNWIS